MTKIATTKMIVALTLAVVMTGCLRTRTDVAEVENKKQMQEQVVTLQRSTADQTVRFQEIDEDIRKLNGRIEVMENQEAQQGGREKSTQTQIDEINKKFALLQESFLKMENDLSILALQAKQSAARPAKEDSAPAVKGNNFDKGEAHFKKKEWKEAIVSYQSYRDKNSSGKSFGEATYKIGVCFQELGMKDEAKVFFEEAIAKFPKTDIARRSRVRLKQVQ